MLKSTTIYRQTFHFFAGYMTKSINIADQVFCNAFDNSKGIPNGTRLVHLVFPSLGLSRRKKYVFSLLLHKVVFIAIKLQLLESSFV